MPTVSELIHDVSEVTNTPREQVTYYARALLDCGLLPKSRGRAIAQVEPVHIVRLFLAVMIEPRVKDTCEMVAQYAALYSLGVPENEVGFLGESLEEFLTDVCTVLLQNDLPQDQRAIRKMYAGSKLTVFTSWQAAMVTYPEGSGEDPRTYAPIGSNPYWKFHLARQATIQLDVFSLLGENRRDYGF